MTRLLPFYSSFVLILFLSAAFAVAQPPTAPLSTPSLSHEGVTLDVEGDYAYILESGGQLEIVDLSDPYQPQLLGLLTLPSSGTHMVAAGDVVYFVTQSNELGRVDVSDRSGPSLLTPIDLGLAESIVSFDVHGSKALVASGTAWTRYVISDPANPIVDTYFSGYAYGCVSQSCTVSVGEVRFQDDVIAVGSYASDSSGGMGVYDVDVSVPTATIDEEYWKEPIDIAFDGNLIFLARSITVGLGVEAYAIDTQTWHYMPTAGLDYPFSVTAANDVLYVRDTNAVHAYDVADPSSASEMWSLDLGAYVNDIDAGTDILCVLLKPSDMAIVGTAGQEPVAVTPAVFSAGLHVAASPNPGRGGTELHFELARRSDVHLEVFDAAGRRVVQRRYGGLPAGPGMIPLDGRELAAGVYYARISAGSEKAVTRVVMLR